MRIYVPTYYKNFKCIADRCKHNCCIGWEIDIDEDTFEYYGCIGGDFGERLKDNIDRNPQPHFVLAENERCPFLNGNNLCDIILKLGEDGLCQICSDHPRFVNFFAGREEIGLGLCCEAACKLILSDTEKFKLEVVEDDGAEEEQTEDEFFYLRERIFEALQEKTAVIDERISKVLEMCGAEFPKKSADEWKSIYKALERLDEQWSEKIEQFGHFEGFDYGDKINTAFENILIYFIYRHMAAGIDDGTVKERVCFAVLSFYAVRSVYSNEADKSLGNLAELCRMYSSEIEYSQDNINSLLDIFKA